MNERIRELQCKAQELAAEAFPGKIPFDPNPNPILWDRIHLSYEKFAELMLVEFTETVKQTATLVAQTGFNDGLSIEEVNKRVNGALRVLDVMRERFGVEE